jgi:hypothetical protein
MPQSRQRLMASGADGPWSNTDDLGDLGVAQLAELAQDHDLAQPRREPLERLSQLVPSLAREDRLVGGLGRGRRVLEAHEAPQAEPPSAADREVDGDAVDQRLGRGSSTWASTGSSAV